MIVLVWKILSAEEAGTTLLDSPIVPTIISASAAMFAAWLMFRGKTQDTANWLIDALRQDAEEARKSAEQALASTKACEAHRQEDLRTIRLMQQNREADRETISTLTERLERLEKRVTKTEE